MTARCAWPLQQRYCLAHYYSAQRRGSLAAVELFGRWGSEALGFLRDAAQETCERSPQLAFLGSWGPVALLGAWHCRLSVALQKGNAACLLQAGRVRDASDFVKSRDASALRKTETSRLCEKPRLW